jgi:hypothetical protein
MEFKIIHKGKRERLIKPLGQRGVLHAGSRQKKHTSAYAKRKQYTRVYENENTAVGSNIISNVAVNERSVGQTAVSEGDFSMRESVALSSSSTAVSKNNGLLQQSFIRRTALKIKKGVERLAHKRRRGNYKRKVSDQRIQENLWKRIRMDEAGRDLLKDNSLFDIIGCDWQQFKIHIEEEFQDGMTWDNYGKWYIDFIDSAALQKWNYKNLIPS